MTAIKTGIHRVEIFGEETFTVFAIHDILGPRITVAYPAIIFILSINIGYIIYVLCILIRNVDNSPVL